MGKVAIIGGGPGGYMAAIRAAQLGLEPVLFEKEAKLGGTCLHRGCIPTKALVEAANRWQELKAVADFGINVPEGAAVDWAKVLSRKDGIVRRMSQGLDGLMKAQGVKVEHGLATLAGPHTVKCGEQEYNFDYIVLATGSEVSVPKVFPVDGERVLTSDHILSYPRIPESMLVVGAGAVGMEFASLFARLGSQVTVIEAMERVLPLEDEDVSAEVKRLARKIGLKIITGASIEQVNVSDEGVSVSGAGLPEKLPAELMLVAVGRRANLAALGADELGIKMERGRICVDEYMRTSIPHIYAIGDLVPTPQLAHVASAEGILAVEHIAGLEAPPIDYDACPGATYCWPEVASVGLSEAKAKERGFSVQVGKFPLAALGKANIIGSTDGFIKVVADSVPHRVLGVHMVGAHVTDMVAEAVVAVRNGLTLEQVAHSVHPHPTLSEAMVEAMHGALGQPLSYVPPAPRRARS
ncbi:dihydrolipoyl dehydrogenase [bacterium]|nr:dihydrolipoyl dehydrogenase [bacterium]